MPHPNFFQRLKHSLSLLSHGERNTAKNTIENQLREAQLFEVQNALLVLCAEVVRASKDFPKHTESLVVNYFNQHFGFIHSQKRLLRLRQHISIGASPYVKISCVQIRNLSTTEAAEEMLSFLFDVAASNHFITTPELRILQQIQRYLGINETVFAILRKKAENTADPYSILGVEPNAAFKEIQSAYRKKVLLFHPDKCRLPMSAEEKNRHFRTIQAAYRLLKEQQRTSGQL